MVLSLVWCCSDPTWCPRTTLSTCRPVRYPGVREPWSRGGLCSLAASISVSFNILPLVFQTTDECRLHFRSPVSSWTVLLSPWSCLPLDDVMPAACRLTGSFTCCGRPQKCEVGDASPSSILHLNILLSDVCIKRFYKCNLLR